MTVPENPYQPPEAEIGPRRNPARFKPLVTVVRVIVGLWGLFILAGPNRFGPSPSPAHHQGQVAAKALGAFLFLVAVFPFGPPRARKAGAREDVPEDL